jgi:hypothetical protein
MDLPSALDAYSAASGLQVLYDGALAGGRRSAPIHGVMAPEAALSAMLKGAGLAASFTKDRNIIIMLDQLSSAEAFGPPPKDYAAPLGTIHVETPLLVGSPSRDRWQAGLYANLVQTELTQALRRNPSAVARRYEAELRIWLNADGVVQRSEFVNPTVDGRLARVIMASIQDVTISQPPPPGLVQPLSVRISVVWR